MNRQYVKPAYLENIAKLASNVIMMSGMNENVALSRIVVSDIYQRIKKNHESYNDEALVNAAKEFCNDAGIVANDNMDVSLPSEILMFKVFLCRMELARIFETVYNVIKTDNPMNIVLDIDIYLHSREIAHQSEL